MKAKLSRVLVLGNPNRSSILINSLTPPYTCDVVNDWHAFEKFLQGDDYPNVLVITADMVNPCGISMLQTMHATNRLPPTAVFFEQTNPEIVAAAWPLAVLGVKPVFEITVLADTVRDLADNEPREFIEYLHQRTGLPVQFFLDLALATSLGACECRRNSQRGDKRHARHYTATSATKGCLESRNGSI